jgi:hypothetical protein
MERLLVCSICIGLALSLASRRRIGMALISAGAAVLLACIPL